MSKVFVNISLSLDGYIAPEGMTMENWNKLDYKDWGAKWAALMAWALNQQYLRERLKLGPGGAGQRHGSPHVRAHRCLHHGQADVRRRRARLARRGPVSHAGLRSHP